MIVAAVYVLVSPPSLDLAAHLFRARLFEVEGFGVYDTFWYGGHTLPGYSVLFPAASAALTPQLAGAIAAAATVPAFTALALRHRGPTAIPGCLLFGVFTAVDLFTGRLAFAFGLLPATLAILALDAEHPVLAGALAVLSAACSPVAALFCGLVAVGHALAGAVTNREHRLRAALPGLGCALAALIPIGLLAYAFGAAGTEPFPLLSMAPILVVSLLGAALASRDAPALRATLVVYALALVLTWLIPTAVGSNLARLGTLLAAPVATVVLWRAHPRILTVVILPLVYLGVQAPVQDVVQASGSPATSVAFYRPLLHFLERRPGAPFRIEIPFTALHWEAYRVATHIPIARGWERQLDIAENPIFYRRGALTASSYDRWLHANGIRYVAVPDLPLDASGRREAALVRGGLPYLRAIAHVGGWRVYAVRHPTGLTTGPARLTALGPDWLTLHASRPAAVLVRLRWSPYWTLTRGRGCVSPAPGGPWTRITLRRPGDARLAIRFTLGRVGADGPRCTHDTNLAHVKMLRSSG